MKRFLVLDYKNRQKFKNMEWKQLIFLFLFKNLNFDKKFRIIFFNFFINDIFKQKFIFRNRCIFNYNVRSVTKFFKISTILFKSFYVKNIIPGIRKSSW